MGRWNVVGAVKSERRSFEFMNVETIRMANAWKMAGLIAAIAWSGAAAVALAAESRIDREALVTRHNPVVREVNYEAPLTVGNGGFAFTVDATGLQTFEKAYYENGIPLETLARWCWFSEANPEGFKLEDANRDYTTADGRVVGIPTRMDNEAAQWLRRNPRLHPLAQLALEWDKPDGSEFVPEDVKDLEQTLDLWRGVVTSRYTLGGVPVEVVTACAQDSDTLAVRVKSELVLEGKLRLRLAFPRGHDPKVKNTPALDWSAPESHVTRQSSLSTIDRKVGGTTYSLNVAFSWEPRVHSQEEIAQRLVHAGTHRFLLKGDRGWDELGVAIGFMRGESREATRRPPEEIMAASARYWPEFWAKAAALDLSGSTNPLAEKLEKRVVLSQYLTAVQCVGDVPPQESGLTCNTWYGKHHTEMIWWHTAHFALWGRPDFLEKNLDWFRERLPEARALAQSRGLKGARWAKMVGPDGRESPGGNPMIVWNQPHLVYLGEILYRENPTRETLEKYRELVLETAECLASMVWLDPKRGEYVLGPPLWIAQEIHSPAESQNPSFELAYWKWALAVAQVWRERLGMEREAHWDDVIAKLSPLPVDQGKYVALESVPDTWTNFASRHDHPQMLMPLGFLPEAPGVDRATMERTFDAVMKEWDWETKIWGWDYPMIAMTAARLGRPQDAVEVLLRDGPNNRYVPNGHCPQRSDTALANGQTGPGRREIAVYLPANGAFLAAVGLMVGGWDGAEGEFPGLPKDGTWTVKAEGWRGLP